MKVFITKYAMTHGIEEVEAEVSETSPDMIGVRHSSGYVVQYHKPFWHTSREEAVTHAEELRKKKLVSLQKALKKLESLLDLFDLQQVR